MSYHGITFNDEKNTWDDWCLIPEEQIIITPPAQKTNYVDIPGASGSLDLSEALTGYPIFSDRTGSITFLVMNNMQTNLPECNPKRVHKLSEDIMEYLHGKKVKMILDDDPLYFYEGRVTLSEIKPDPNWSTITMNYTLNPYKWSIFSSVDTNWLWDPFSFDDGVIYKGLYSDITLKSGWNSFEFNSKLAGTAAMQIGIRVYSSTNPSTYFITNMQVIADSVTKSYSRSLNKNIIFYPEDFVSHGQDFTIRIYRPSSSDVIKADIIFRPGRL